MTFENWIKTELEANGMFDSQAIAAVLEAVKTVQPSMSERWNHDMEGYPASVQAGLWLTTKHCALEWIDANLPLAFYRAMFA